MQACGNWRSNEANMGADHIGKWGFKWHAETLGRIHKGGPEGRQFYEVFADLAWKRNGSWGNCCFSSSVNKATNWNFGWQTQNSWRNNTLVFVATRFNGRYHWCNNTIIVQKVKVTQNFGQKLFRALKILCDVDIVSDRAEEKEECWVICCAMEF